MTGSCELTLLTDFLGCFGKSLPASGLEAGLISFCRCRVPLSFYSTSSKGTWLFAAVRLVVLSVGHHELQDAFESTVA